MSKKTKAEKLAAKRKRRIHVNSRKGKRPNPAFGSFLSDAAMRDVIATTAFGALGSELLRALGIDPIQAAAAIQQGLAGTVSSESPSTPIAPKGEE
jgi:hypothetical protein